MGLLYKGMGNDHSSADGGDLKRASYAEYRKRLGPHIEQRLMGPEQTGADGKLAPVQLLAPPTSTRGSHQHVDEFSIHITTALWGGSSGNQHAEHS